MDTERLVELASHYIAMLLLVFAALFVIRRTLGDLGFWYEFAIVLVIAILYRPIVVRLGVAPSAWENNRMR